VPRLVHEPGAEQVVQNGADLALAVRRKPFQHVRATRAPFAPDVLEHRLPQGSIGLARRLREPLDLLLIAAERQPEHVRGDPLCDALRVELAREIEEDLVRDLRERRSDAGGRRQLSDEDRRLLHDAVDEEPDVHGAVNRRS